MILRGILIFQQHLGEEMQQKKIKIRYLVVDACTSYNALLGRFSLNKLGAIMSTPHLAMKFLLNVGI